MFIKKPCRTCGQQTDTIDPAWLRSRREKAGLSLRQLALRLKFSAPYLSDIENGRRNCTDAILKSYKAL